MARCEYTVDGPDCPGLSAECRYCDCSTTCEQWAARKEAKLRAFEEAFKWKPIETAPRNATEILLEVPRGGGKGWPTHMKIVGHWADGGGDEQPRFRGWFQDDGYGYREIKPDPVRWAPLPEGLERR